MLTDHAGAIRRRFTSSQVEPLEEVEWTKSPAWKEGDPHYRAEVEHPKAWSKSSVDITAKLYLAKGKYREDSIRALIKRVSWKITCEGVKAGYFGEHDTAVDYEGKHQANVFLAELEHIMVNQMACFNSPVLFNIGRPDRPQSPSACYLLGVEDNSEDIMKWTRDEAFIFKGGAGSGVNVSNLRGSMEPLSPGGEASGPVSFMRLTDASNGTFKSGGVTRRGAALRCIDDDHPDLMDFIWCKAHEEERLRALGEAGFDISMSKDGERTVAESTAYQNANNSVRLTDAFMRKATGEDPDSFWPLVARKKGNFEDDWTSTVEAPMVLEEIAKAAHACADPGVQFHDTINSWHTTPNDGPIRTSNPCSETMLPDDSSCNLASINIMKFLDEDGSFDVGSYRHVVDVMITAMDILVEFCELPTEELTRRTKEFRWLGLGYTNMGAAIMSQGLAYDSDGARDFAAAVTALTTGRAYDMSARLAEQIGPFEGYQENSKEMRQVIDKHLTYLPLDDTLDGSLSVHAIWIAACMDWVDARRGGDESGYRNAQAVVIAPTGSISFFMGADTTGIEPAFSLVSHKELAGGGTMKLVNQSVERGLKALKYDSGVIKRILEHLEDTGTMPTEGDEALIRNVDHQEIFAGANDISPEGHVKMVAAVQPLISGCSSKTINMPTSATWEEIRDVYVMAWRLGAKALAIYRDGSKARQVLSSKPRITSKQKEYLPGGKMYDKPWVGGLPQAETPHAEDAMEGHVGPERRRMPRDRASITHKFNLGGFEGYLIVGKYEDGTPGEIFIEDIGKEGSTLRGMMNAWAIQVSTSLQYGQPLEVMVRKYTNMCFEPNGRTECSEVPTAQSLPDYIMRWMALHFLPHMHEELGILTVEEKQRRTAELDAREAFSNYLINGAKAEGNSFSTQELKKLSEHVVTSASSNGNGKTTMSDQMCPDCGGLLQRAGSCLQCRCGYSGGGCG